MEILLDVDGVVADFSGYLLRSVYSELTADDVICWDIMSLMTEEQRVMAIARLKSADWWLNQPVMLGAKEAVETLREDGHNIHWVTSPWYSCARWEWARRLWLDRHFGAKPQDITSTYRKDLICGDVLVDDKFEHVHGWCRRQERPGILFDAPYNRDMDTGEYIVRSKGWGRVEIVIKVMAL